MVRCRTSRAPGGFFSGLIVGVLLTYFLLRIEFSKLSVANESLSPGRVILESKSASPVSSEEESYPLEEVTWPAWKGIDRKSESEAVARSLKGRVRILCCVMTTPDGFESTAAHIEATWGRRCNSLLFMTSRASRPLANNLSLPIVELDVPDGGFNMWEQTQAAFKYIYKRRFQGADWFFIANDATYAIVENLRHLLKDQTPKTAVYMGRRFKHYADQGFMGGAAGYVLSRAAVRRFVTVLSKTPSLCPDTTDIPVDVQLGMCLQRCGVKAMDTRDVLDRQRFLPLAPWDHLMTGHFQRDFWLFSYDYYATEFGSECCSDYTITFSYITPQMMYLLDFFVYHIKPYGIAKNCDLFEDT